MVKVAKRRVALKTTAQKAIVQSSVFAGSPGDYSITYPTLGKRKYMKIIFKSALGRDVLVPRGTCYLQSI